MAIRLLLEVHLGFQNDCYAYDIAIAQGYLCLDTAVEALMVLKHALFMTATLEARDSMLSSIRGLDPWSSLASPSLTVTINW